MPQPPLEAWKEAEGELFRLLVENVADYAIFVVDPQGLVQSWNPGAQRLLGYRADEILGRSSEILFTPEDVRDGIPQREMRDALERGADDDDRWHVRKDGSRFWSGGKMTPLRDEAGRLRGFAKIMRDRTEWKRQQEECDLAEQARRQSETRGRAILLTALDCIIMMDHEGAVVEFNPAAESTFGYSRAEAVGRPLAELIIPPSLREQHYRGLAHYLATGEGPLLGKRLELSAVRADGREFPVELAITRIPIEGPPLFTAYLRDITDQRRGEAALRESEAAQRLLADTITQLAWMARSDGHIFWYNRRWYDYTGTTPEQMEGWGWQSVHDPAVLPSVLARWKHSLATGEAFDMVFPLRGADGRFRPFLTRVNPLRDEAGRLMYWFGTNTDISEQQRAAEMSHFLADASATLAALVDYESTLAKMARLAVPFFADWCAVDMVSDDGLLRRLAVVHNDPAKIDLAHELSRRYPPRPDDPYGPPHVLRTGQPEMATEITDAVLAQSAQDADHLRILRELGLRSYISVPLLLRAQPLGVVTFIMAESHRAYGPADLELAQDLAHRAAIAIENARLYRQLKDADRRKDEFLATLAHELRNPLAPVRNSLQILKMERVDAETAQHVRGIMERQVDHLTRLVDDLLDVSRVMRGKIDLRKEKVELASVVARAIETAQPLIEVQRHQLDVSLPAESLPLEADPVRLAQVIGNLLTNAAKYTEANGCIGLTARREADEAVLTVRDNGIGIAPDMLPHVFDLFVQADHAATRSQGGLGIGLTLVKNLVQMHDGSVEAHSAGLGEGSEFVVRLPLMVTQHQAPMEKVHGGAGSGTPPSGRRFLVVDDNHDAAQSLAMLLRLQGHDVRVANDGPTALALAASYRPDLVFLDIGMPGMDGYEVARRIRQTPELRQIVLAALTGWGQQEDRRRTAEAGFDQHLVKPLELKALENVLAGLKGSHASHGGE